jgi:hypothetical protein
MIMDGVAYPTNTTPIIMVVLLISNARLLSKSRRGLLSAHPPAPGAICYYSLLHHNTNDYFSVGIACVTRPAAARYCCTRNQNQSKRVMQQTIK